MKTIEELEKENIKLNKKIHILVQAVNQARVIKQKFNESTQLLREKDKELNYLNENLEKRVKEEVEENRKKDLKLLEQVRMAAMGETIGNIAHQWRQPLNVIIMQASNIIIDSELKNITTKELLKGMENIIEEVQSLSKTISMFSNFLKHDKTYKDVLIKEEIDNSFSIVSAIFNSKHIKLINNIKDDNNIRVKLIKGELSQVIINILNNAKDVLEEKKIEDSWVSISLAKKENKAVITIEDNGGGISEDVLPKIFEPYFTTKHQAQGTGLGLYISYKIITESLKGKIYAENTKNGAKLFIELPLSNKDIL